MKQTRTARLIRLVQLLQSGRRYDPDTLAVELRVSRRTVYRDIKILKQSGVPCAREEGTESYSIDQSYFLRPVNLTLEEGLALMLLTRKFIHRRVIPYYTSAMTAGMKIESALPPEVRRHCGELLDKVDAAWPPVSDADSITDVMMKLQSAVLARKKVRVHYDSYYEKREIETVLRPYGVVFRGRAWYLIAFSEFHQMVRTFKLERIVELAESDQAFLPDRQFDIATYFGNAWNMIRSEQLYHVEVHFSKKVAGNVEEVAWHPTQRTRRRSDGSLIFEVDVDGVEEISWWVLGYGDQAVVREPECLRTLIASHAENLARYYQTGQTKPRDRD